MVKGISEQRYLCQTSTLVADVAELPTTIYGHFPDNLN